jgi:hypothetical protein
VKGEVVAMKEKKVKFNEDILEYLEVIEAERKSSLSKIVNDLLRVAWENDAHLEFTGEEPEGYMEWVDRNEKEASD